MKSKFVGGIYALNRELLENINFNRFWDGNEYVEEQCIKMGKAKCISLSDFFKTENKRCGCNIIGTYKKINSTKYIYNSPRMLEVWKDASELDELLKILKNYKRNHCLIIL